MQNDIKIPLEFIKKNTKLSWEDTLWGYRQNLLSWNDVVSLAVDSLACEGNDPLELELALVDESNYEMVPNILQQLAGKYFGSEDTSKKKWLYLLLLWLFKHKDSRADPLTDVEIIYADFGYPESVSTFVRYMPAIPTRYLAQDEAQVGIDRIYKNWNIFLQEGKKEFGTS